jgi:D-glycero-D-manno-heptose 1,7-bisphosphate phosphatase
MHNTVYSARSKSPVPAVFLDRDGTINVEKNHIYHISDWEWIAGAKESLCRFKAAGFAVIIVSNQSGIARCMYTHDDVNHLHEQVIQQLDSDQPVIDAIYFCPHHPDFGSHTACECRKPEPGMLLRAAADLNIDLENSWIVGDKLSDLEAGVVVGVRAILVRTGHGAGQEANVAPCTQVMDNLFEAALFIEAETSMNLHSSSMANTLSETISLQQARPQAFAPSLPSVDLEIK